MKTIALIPARGGSKGFPHKNIARINGFTLIELAVRVGLDCEKIDAVYISTDNREYEKIACCAGAKSLGLRPPGLATDTAKSVDAVIDFLQKLDHSCETLVLLQPTSPMRTPADINIMLEQMKTTDASAMVSVEKVEEPHPHKLKKLSDKGWVEPFLSHTSSEISRQLLPDVYKLNGAIYIARCKTILTQATLLPEKTMPYIMGNTINIDSKNDFHIIQGLIKLNKIKIYGTDSVS